MEFLPDRLVELLAQMPVAGLMLVVVWKFLQVIKERDTNWLETVRQRDDYFLGELAKHQIAAVNQHNETVEVIRQNAIALHQSAKTMERVESKLTADSYERAQHRRGG